MLTTTKTVLKCIKAVSQAFGVPVSALRWGGAEFDVSHPRQAVMLLARWMGHSFGRIGRTLGNRDHSTVVHGSRAAAKRADADEEYGDNLQMAWIALTTRNPARENPRG